MSTLVKEKNFWEKCPEILGNAFKNAQQGHEDISANYQAAVKKYDLLVSQEREKRNELAENMVYGFSTSDGAAIKNAIEDECDKLVKTDIINSFLADDKKECEDNIIKHKKFSQSAIDFSAKLSSKGIYPMTILPVEMFNNIFQKAKSIYLFKNLNERGETHCDLNSCYSVNLQVDSWPFGIWILLSPLCIIGAVVALVLSNDLRLNNQIIPWFLSGWSIGLLFLVGCFMKGFFLAAVGLGVVVYKLWSKIMVYCLSHKLLVKVIFPQRCDNDDRTNKVAVRLMFITAPDSFIISIKKLINAGYHPCIGADYAAFKIDRKALDANVQDRFKVMPVPVIEDKEPFVFCYNKDKTAVAIVDAFGDFPREKEMLEEMKSWGLQMFFN